MSETPAHLSEPEAVAWGELAARWPDSVPMPEGAEFEAWLGQVARLRDAQRAIAADGLIVADPKGIPMPHPALEIERRAQIELRTWGDKFDPRKYARRAR
jgi:hypothetical protein